MPVSCAPSQPAWLRAKEPRTNLDCKHATLQDLSQFPWIINQDGSGFRGAIQRRFEQEHLPLRIGMYALSSDLTPNNTLG